MSPPLWLIAIAWVSLGLAVICFIVIIVDLILGNKQHMWIMNLVWPITALYAGPIAVYAYFTIGRLSTHKATMGAKYAGKESPAKQKPFWQMVALGATHCGSGCALGDLLAEWLIFLVPFTIFGKKIFGAWTLDYLLALAFGVAFQYFTIQPMRDLSPKEGIKQAIKADFLSLTSWQLGMYGWMAIVTFVIFGHEIEKTNPVFWFMMQIAMIFGFFTSYPINRWLLKNGIKEKM